MIDAVYYRIYDDLIWKRRNRVYMEKGTESNKATAVIVKQVRAPTSSP